MDHNEGPPPRDPTHERTREPNCCEWTTMRPPPRDFTYEKAGNQIAACRAHKLELPTRVWMPNMWGNKLALFRSVSAENPGARDWKVWDTCVKRLGCPCRQSGMPLWRAWGSGVEIPEWHVIHRGYSVQISGVIRKLASLQNAGGIL